MRIDWTLLIKSSNNDSYYEPRLSTPTKMPKYWDKNSFITWILCGSKRNKELPKLKEK